jgi:hypothetical protein
MTIPGIRADHVRERLGYDPQTHDEYVVLISEDGRDDSNMMYVYPVDVPLYHCEHFIYMPVKKSESIEDVKSTFIQWTQ